jgi:hypothetical protein
MAVENVIILKLVETHANLISINPALGNGQEVIVDMSATGYDIINRPKKIGDSIILYNILYFVDIIEVETDTNYDLTASWIAINNNRIQITNMHATNTISLTGTSFTLGPLTTGNYRRSDDSWIEISNYGNITVWSSLTTYGLDWVVSYNQKLFISKQAGNTDHTPVGGGGDSWWKLWPEADDVLITDAGGHYTATNVEDALQEVGPNIETIVDPISNIKSFPIYRDRLSTEGRLPFAFDNAVSQTGDYADLYTEILDIYEQQHLDAGDSASGAGNFYPTPVPGAYGRSAIPDVEFDETDISGNALQISFPTGFRDGTIFLYEVLTGTTITNLVDGTLYYMKRNGATLEFYPTEADAIAGTSQILPSGGSGTFRLTQEGIAIDNALEEHGHDFSRNNTENVDSGAAFSVYGSPSDSPNHVLEVINANVSNETRPQTFYEFDYIKAKYIF